MSSKTVHTCYGCPYYYRETRNGEIEYMKPYSYRHCDIKDTWDCDYFANGGEPTKIRELRGGENE